MSFYFLCFQFFYSRFIQFFNGNMGVMPCNSFIRIYPILVGRGKLKVPIANVIPCHRIWIETATSWRACEAPVETQRRQLNHCLPLSIRADPFITHHQNLVELGVATEMNVPSPAWTGCRKELPMNVSHKDEATLFWSCCWDCFVDASLSSKNRFSKILSKGVLHQSR